MTITRIFSVLALIFIAGVVWWLESIISTAQDDELRVKNNRPNFYLENFELHQYSQYGVLEYQAQGQSMIQYPIDDGMDVEQMTMHRYPPDKSIVTVKADNARLLEEGKQIHLSGNVHIHQAKSNNNDLLDIKTEKLFVDNDSKYMETNKPITIRTDKHEISGTGMQAWTEKRKFRLLSNVRGRHEP